MLQKVSRVLLITDKELFREDFKALAEDIEVEVSCEEEWNNKYRINADVVVTGSHNLEYINEAYYNKTVILLKEGENPAPFIKMGIERFVFNYKNKNELLYAMFKQKPVVVYSHNMSYEELMADSDTLNYCEGDYDFKFDKGVFKYKGRPIYLTPSAKKYLAEWLLNGNKDNSKRIILFNLRKRLGNDFLKDVDREGKIKGVKHE